VSVRELPPLWVSGFAYGRGVLRGGEDPWEQPASLPMFLRELGDLLSPGVEDLDADATLAGMAPAGVVDPDDLVELLEGDDFQSRVADAIAAVAGSNPSRPLALTLPGAGRLARRYLGEDAPDEDLLDDLAMALTQVLRAVYRPALAFLVLREEDPAALDLHEPLVNVAAHYDLSLCAVCPDAPDTVEGFDHVYNRDRIVPADYWTGAAAAPAASPSYAEMPADLNPESALEKLAALR